MGPAERQDWVASQARALGFDLCGIAPAEDFPELNRLPEWLVRGYAGEMAYLHDTRRRSPRLVLDGARSIIVCALNYNTPLPYSTEFPTDSPPPAQTRAGVNRPATGAGGQGEAFPEHSRGSPAMSRERKKGALAPEEEAGPRGWISRYAWGDDYHAVLLEKLDALIAAMRENIAEPFEARAYVDTGPVVERLAAHHAGLGWLAKNTCLINPELGSWLFLGVIVTTLEVAPSLEPAQPPPPDLCGNCQLCMDACPTGAIVEPYVLDARRCISYLTIELRGPIPEELRAPMGRMVFGCDICQDVCPWNRRHAAGHAPVSTVDAFHPRAPSISVPTSPAFATLCHSEPGAVAPSKAEGAGEESQRRKGSAPSCHSEAPAVFAGAEESQPTQTREIGGTLEGPANAQRATLFAPALEWLASLTEEEFRQVFRGSAVKRAKWRGLVRNACIALGNSGVRPGDASYKRVTACLERLSQSTDPTIAEHAQWALSRLRPLSQTGL